VARRFAEAFLEALSGEPDATWASSLARDGAFHDRCRLTTSDGEQWGPGPGPVARRLDLAVEQIAAAARQAGLAGAWAGRARGGVALEGPAPVEGRPGWFEVSYALPLGGARHRLTDRVKVSGGKLRRIVRTRG